MGQKLSTDCDLFRISRDYFLSISPDSEIIDIEVKGDGSVKVWYQDEGNRDHWSASIIYLMRNWLQLHVKSTTIEPT